MHGTFNPHQHTVHILIQVLSESVSKALQLTGGEEVSETAKFVQMMGHFFDCLNVNSFNKGKQRRKEFQDPYRYGSDFRLKVCFSFPL